MMNDKHESIFAAFARPFRRNGPVKFAAALIFSFIPLLNPAASAIAYTPDDKKLGVGDAVKLTVKMGLIRLLLFAPALMVFSAALLISNLTSPGFIPYAVFTVLILVFAVPAFIRLPMAMCMAADGFSICEALSPREANALIGRCMGRYVLSFALLLPLVLLGALLGWLPVWLQIIICGIIYTYIQFVGGRCFNSCYDRAQAGEGARRGQRGRSLRFAAMTLACIMLLNSLSGCAPKGAGGQYTSGEYSAACRRSAMSGELSSRTYMSFDGLSGKFRCLPKPGDRARVISSIFFGMVSDSIPVVSNVKCAFDAFACSKAAVDPSRSEDERQAAKALKSVNIYGALAGPSFKLPKWGAGLSGKTLVSFMDMAGGARPTVPGGEFVPELQIAAKMEDTAVKGYIYCRLLLENLLETDITATDPDEMRALLSEAVSAWEAEAELCESMLGYLDKIHIPQSGLSAFSCGLSLPEFDLKNLSSAFFSAAYAQEARMSEQELKDWAKSVSQNYDRISKNRNLTVHQRFVQLGNDLGTDARTAAELLQQAEGMLSEGYRADGEFAEKWMKGLMVVKTGCKVGLFIGGLAISGGITGAAGTWAHAMQTGAVVIGGVDCVVDVGNTGSNLFLGEDHVVTKRIESVSDALSPISSIFSLANFAYSFKTAENLSRTLAESGGDLLSYCWDTFQGWYQDGKIMGVELVNPGSTYVNDPTGGLLAGTFGLKTDGLDEEQIVQGVRDAGGPDLSGAGTASVSDLLEDLGLTSDKLRESADAVKEACENLIEQMQKASETPPVPQQGADTSDITPQFYAGTYKGVLVNRTHSMESYGAVAEMYDPEMTVTISESGTASISYTYETSYSYSLGQAGVEQGGSSVTPVDMRDLQLTWNESDNSYTGDFSGYFTTSSELTYSGAGYVGGGGNLSTESETKVEVAIDAVPESSGGGCVAVVVGTIRHGASENDPNYAQIANNYTEMDFRLYKQG